MSEIEALREAMERAVREYEHDTGGLVPCDLRGTWDELRAALAQPSEPGLDVEAVTDARRAVERLPHNGSCSWQSGNNDCDCHKADALAALARLASEPTDA